MPDLNCNYIFWGTSVFDSKNTYVYASFCRKTLGTCLDSGCDRLGFFYIKAGTLTYLQGILTFVCCDRLKYS